MDAGWSTNYQIYKQAYDQIINSMLDKFQDKLFPEQDQDDSKAKEMKKQLGIEIGSAIKNDFNHIFKETIEKHNVKATLDAHYVLSEKKELIKKVSQVSNSMVKYDGADKIQKMAEYLKEVKDVKNLLHFHSGKYVQK